METVFASWEAIDLTENHVKQLHRDLLKHSARDERRRGEYKTLPNHVEAFGPDGESLGVVFATASPFETPGRMAELAAWTRASLNRGELHPLLAVAVFVAASLESVIERSKDAYARGSSSAACWICRSAARRPASPAPAATPSRTT